MRLVGEFDFGAVAVEESAGDEFRERVLRPSPASDLFRAKVVDMIKKLGDYEVSSASNGHEALDLLEASGDDPFDIVLTDMWMPEMDGEGLAKAIRASVKLKALPVYAITADVELKSTFAEKGFDSMVLKPITAGKLLPLLSGRPDQGGGEA